MTQWWNVGRLVADAIGAGLAGYGSAKATGTDDLSAAVAALVAAITAVVQRQRPTLGIRPSPFLGS